MTKISALLPALLIFLLLQACSPQLSPFTQDLYEEGRWSEGELKRIQFYLSGPITLSRTISEGESTISEGKIRLVNGRKIEEIVIPGGTPGVLLFMPKSDRFAISFEENENDLYLMFGPNPNIDNRYALLAKEWKKREGKVQYNGRLYNVDSNSAYSTLMVDLREIRKLEVQSRRASGRKVEG